MLGDYQKSIPVEVEDISKLYSPGRLWAEDPELNAAPVIRHLLSRYFG